METTAERILANHDVLPKVTPNIPEDNWFARSPFQTLTSWAEDAQLDIVIDTRVGKQSQMQDFTSKASPEEVQVMLENESVWTRFHSLGLEMVLTREGRRMFPCCRFRIHGLSPSASYSLILSMSPVDTCKHRFNGDRWEMDGASEQHTETQVYLHPDSPSLGHRWMDGPVSFYRMKLASDFIDRHEGVVLRPMHHYRPILYVVPASTFSESGGDLLMAPHGHAFTFPKTDFYAVMSYQNPELTRLKMECNPFILSSKRRAAQMLEGHANSETDGEEQLSLSKSSHLQPESVTAEGNPPKRLKNDPEAESAQGSSESSTTERKHPRQMLVCNETETALNLDRASETSEYSTTERKEWNPESYSGLNEVSEATEREGKHYKTPGNCPETSIPGNTPPINISPPSPSSVLWKSPVKSSKAQRLSVPAPQGTRRRFRRPMRGARKAKAKWWSHTKHGKAVLASSASSPSVMEGSMRPDLEDVEGVLFISFTEREDLDVHVRTMSKTKESPSEELQRNILKQKDAPVVIPDQSKIAEWRRKFQSKATSSSVNDSAFCSEKLDAYLENETLQISDQFSVLSSDSSPVTYQLPLKSSSYVRTLDSVLRRRHPAPKSGFRGDQHTPVDCSRSSTQTWIVSGGALERLAVPSAGPARVRSKRGRKRRRPVLHFNREALDTALLNPEGNTSRLSKMRRLEERGLLQMMNPSLISRERAMLAISALICSETGTPAPDLLLQQSECVSASCRLGCVCDSLNRKWRGHVHCGRPEPSKMLEILSSCNWEPYRSSLLKELFSQVNEDRLSSFFFQDTYKIELLSKVLHRDQHSSSSMLTYKVQVSPLHPPEKKMGKEERKFVGSLCGPFLDPPKSSLMEEERHKKILSIPLLSRVTPAGFMMASKRSPLLASSIQAKLILGRVGALHPANRLAAFLTGRINQAKAQSRSLSKGRGLSTGSKVHRATQVNMKRLSPLKRRQRMYLPSDTIVPASALPPGQQVVLHSVAGTQGVKLCQFNGQMIQLVPVSSAKPTPVQNASCTGSDPDKVQPPPPISLIIPNIHSVPGRNGITLSNAAQNRRLNKTGAFSFRICPPTIESQGASGAPLQSGEAPSTLLLPGGYKLIKLPLLINAQTRPDSEPGTSASTGNSQVNSGKKNPPDTPGICKEPEEQTRPDPSPPVTTNCPGKLMAKLKEKHFPVTPEDQIILDPSVPVILNLTKGTHSRENNEQRSPVDQAMLDSPVPHELNQLESTYRRNDEEKSPEDQIMLESSVPDERNQTKSTHRRTNSFEMSPVNLVEQGDDKECPEEHLFEDPVRARSLVKAKPCSTTLLSNGGVHNPLFTRIEPACVSQSAQNLEPRVNPAPSGGRGRLQRGLRISSETCSKSIDWLWKARTGSNRLFIPAPDLNHKPDSNQILDPFFFRLPDSIQILDPDENTDLDLIRGPDSVRNSDPDSLLHCSDRLSLKNVEEVDVETCDGSQELVEGLRVTAGEVGQSAAGAHLQKSSSSSSLSSSRVAKTSHKAVRCMGDLPLYKKSRSLNQKLLRKKRQLELEQSLSSLRRTVSVREEEDITDLLTKTRVLMEDLEKQSRFLMVEKRALIRQHSHYQTLISISQCLLGAEGKGASPSLPRSSPEDNGCSERLPRIVLKSFSGS
ncbi:hypothetical protein DNTS_009829 [Danionella cerebrum]|uniref:T-box domain-containing protein n=1 Tax=Danionella cerebrum TaxID=2873325 RepID=A0A553MXQ9_9TELE|nr:hypothetical protein DNTS_009829 [Danionella translucida]